MEQAPQLNPNVEKPAKPADRIFKTMENQICLQLANTGPSFAVALNSWQIVTIFLHSFSKTFPNVHRKCPFSFVRNFSVSGTVLSRFSWWRAIASIADAENSAAKAAQEVLAETAHVHSRLAKKQPKKKAEVKKTAKKNQQNKKKRSRQTPEEKKAEIALISCCLNEKTKWPALQQIYKADKEKNFKMDAKCFASRLCHKLDKEDDRKGAQQVHQFAFGFLSMDVD